MSLGAWGPLVLFASFFSETVALPGFGDLGSIHPGARLGVERPWTHGPVQLLQVAHVSAYGHRELHDAGLLATELVVRPHLGVVFADLGLGGGAMLVREDLPRFRDGEPRSPWGAKAALVTGVGLGVQPKERVEVYTRLELIGEVPFGLNGNPLLPHRTIHLGLRASFGGAR